MEKWNDKPGTSPKPTIALPPSLFEAAPSPTGTTVRLGQSSRRPQGWPRRGVNFFRISWGACLQTKAGHARNETWRGSQDSSVVSPVSGGVLR